MTSQSSAGARDLDAPKPLIPRQLLKGPAWFAVVLPPLVPVLLWLRSDAVAVAFGSATGALRSLALLAGLCGYAAFATNLILSARVPAVERLFGSLDRMYRFHRRLAAAVAALLVAHVALIFGSQAATPAAGVAELLRPDPGWRVFAGVVAFAGFATILAVTLLARLRHEPFLRVHRVFGLVFCVGALHALRVQGVGAGIPLLDGYLAVLTAAAVAAWVYRSGLGRTLVRRDYYRVAALRPHGASIAEVVLTPADEPLDFEPGQHVFIGVNDPAVGRELHPFSITSAPGDPTLRLAVKAVGDYTRAMANLEPGAGVRVEGPYGSFSYLNVNNLRQVWIAGGIGLTPFLSMARSLSSGDHEIDFYYCMEDGHQGYFLDELYDIADRVPRLRVAPIRRDRLGFVSASDIAGLTPGLSDKDILICGPPAMIDVLEHQFIELGVPRRRIHFEKFGFV